MEEEEGLRARSFRHEDYNTRRAFLRSYPLQWDDETGEEMQTDTRESAAIVSTKKGKAASVKKKLIMVLHWGEGKCLILRRLKEKLVYYLVVCHGFSSLGFKSSDKMVMPFVEIGKKYCKFDWNKICSIYL
ncbi:hypothetical protein LUZ63_008472 [Rhynchospora breviuscula]|uniref:Uncharacterized protein n=1 Tax=Rhynchospora breviuscula TaxID=2022672 RepID=A0A9Q0HW02_9POAL|nr:hypothetical protein LUZ63_008472 [Rhynchospora breviuscula]